MSEALIGPIYGGVLGLGRHFRLLYGTQALDYLLKTPTPTPAELTTWLDTPANLDAYQRLIATNAGASAVCASSGAMAAIAGSATARERLYYSSTGRAAVVSSKTAMDAVLAAGAAAISPMLSFPEMRTAVYDNATAFASLVASAEGKSALSGLMLSHNTNSTTHVYPTGVNATTRTVLISQRATSSMSYAGAVADTYSTSSSAYVDRFVRVTGLTHRIGSSASTSGINYVVMQ